MLHVYPHVKIYYVILIRMSFYRGGGGYRPRGGRMPMQGGSRFGLAPLMRPDSNFRGRHAAPFRGSFRPPRQSFNRGAFDFNKAELMSKSNFGIQFLQ